MQSPGSRWIGGLTVPIRVHLAFGRENGWTVNWTPCRPHPIGDFIEEKWCGKISIDRLLAKIVRSAKVESCGGKPPSGGFPISNCNRLETRIEPILRAAQPRSLDRLYLAVGGVGCCVFSPIVTAFRSKRRGGASSDDATFCSWRLWPGTVWGEGRRYQKRDRRI